MMLIAAALAVTGSAAAQSDFHIVWVVVGELASGNETTPVRAGKHLFMARDLVELSLSHVNVVQVDVNSPVRELQVGDRLCLSELEVSTLDQHRQSVANAPLSVSVRQDHRRKLGLRRSKRDLCVQPQEPGEYPVRLTSMLPAPDGTTRGAQMFLRVTEKSDVHTRTAEGEASESGPEAPASSSARPSSALIQSQ